MWVINTTCFTTLNVTQITDSHELLAMDILPTQKIKTPRVRPYTSFHQIKLAPYKNKF